ncbi:MAG: glucosaminidase domain-containing protein [Bacteroidia bacterium]|nr:glucosaminidase domain-containing protein [Bacteroidia bacterium]MCZ2277048.1 glucosaminidase domain-containing protein [Bacteroidia bacterium]
MEKNCMKLALILLLFTQQILSQPAQQRLSKEEYIQQFQDDAIKDMLLTGVPASIKLAQGILESDCGNSKLAQKAFNHFGIKCHSDWKGETFHQDDDEKNECFRKYNSVLESFDDHSFFLKNRPRYAFLFDLKISDYKGWAHGLKKAGYATNPNYAHQLIKIIEDYNLNELDKTGKRIPVASSGNENKPVKQEAPARRVILPVADLNTINNTPFVTAQKGDSYFSIAVKNNMGLWQVLRYNDADKSDVPAEGEVVFIKPKRNKALREYHTVAYGETLRGISQLYGIKLKKLLKYNNLTLASKIQPGEKLKLK